MLENLTLLQGDTFSHVVRWETEPVMYKAITAVAAVAPATITATSHGLTNGWRAAVISCKGMTQINSAVPPRPRDYHPITVIDANTIAMADINAADFSTYTSGGYLQFNTPVDLTGYTARMSIKDAYGGTELIHLDTTARIAIDNAAKTITLTIDAATTGAITWINGVYDLELISASGVVKKLLSGAVVVLQAVTLP